MDETGRDRPGTPEAGRGTGASGSWLRWLPLSAVLAILAASYALGLHHFLTLAALRFYQDTLEAFVAARPVAAAAAYVAVYVLVVAVSFPGAGIMTIAGGFLFGALAGTILASLGSIAGATVFFLVARSSLGTLLAERAGPRTQRLRRGFQEEGFGYLLFLRLVPVFPFWIVNLAGALFGMRLSSFVAATAVGVWPAAFVFAYVGRGLGSALAGEGASVPVELLVGVSLLAVLALVPVLVRRRRARAGAAR